MRSNEVLNVGIVGCGFVAKERHSNPVASLGELTSKAMERRQAHRLELPQIALR